MLDLPDEKAKEVDDLIEGAASIRGAILLVSEYLNRPPAQVAEYVTVFRTGRFDVLPETQSSDDRYAQNPSGVQIEEHGELGPVIVDPTHDFTSQSDL